MTQGERIIVADWTWCDGRLQRELAVHVGSDGRISQVDPAPADGGAHLERLRHRALFPGMVYAHSHAFQRALRSRPERFDAGSGDFWTWRDSMYRLVETMDADMLYETCRQCFAEMLSAGVTAVGEFHYVHHLAEDALWVLDDAILAAARDAGIRLALIQCYYAAGGIGRPLAGAQRRFDARSMPEFLEQLERLWAKLDPRTQSLALAAHSVRAASIEDIATLHAEARRRSLPFHLHVEEQRAEIEQCVAATGANPLRLLLDRLRIDDLFTAVHCTHSSLRDLAELAARGGRVCLCPSTEGNLADGVPKLRDMRAAGVPVCIGSDCNLRICMFEELRWLEFTHRLCSERSGVIVNDDGEVAPALLELATSNGAASLRLETGEIAPGRWADLFSVDLTHPSLADCAPQSVAHALVFGCGNEPIRDVWVAGQRIPR